MYIVVHYTVNVICILSTAHSFPLIVAKRRPGVLKRTLDPISEDTFDFGEYVYIIVSTVFS